MPTTLEQIQYGFDRDSRRTWQKRPLTTLQDQAYQYDPLSQVNAAARGSLNLNGTAISGTPTLAESWAFDPTGNWRGYQTSTAGTVTLDQHRVHDRGNRLTQIEGNPHNQVLDRAGRVRQTAPDASGDWNGKLEITWDAWSRITRVKNNGTVVGEYRYDGQHRRTERTVNGGDTHHSYYNDQWRPVEERKNSETTASVSYLWGSRHRDDLVRRDRAVGGTSLNETRYVMMDYFNPAAITDAAGVVKERYAFSAFGVRTILNPDYSTRSSSESSMEFGFQGQFLDGESGLMNYGYRYYAPWLGRWTCKDPIMEKGGVNLYVLVGNGVVNAVDHLGLFGMEFEMALLNEQHILEKPPIPLEECPCCQWDEFDRVVEQQEGVIRKLTEMIDRGDDINPFGQRERAASPGAQGYRDSEYTAVGSCVAACLDEAEGEVTAILDLVRVFVYDTWASMERRRSQRFLNCLEKVSDACSKSGRRFSSY
jgi:RHS repeat-associated protein